MPQLDDDDFDSRPTLPKAAANAPLLLPLTTEDFVRGWVGHRPSYRSVPSALPVLPEKRRPWIVLVIAATLFGAGLLARTMAAQPSASSVAAQIAPLPEPTVVKEPEPPARIEVVKTDKSPIVVAVPKAVLIQPVPVFPKPVGLSASKAAPATGIAVVAPPPEEKPSAPEEKPAAPPEPPPDPNGGVMNAGF